MATDDSEKLIRFDWAIRYMLRVKADFDILEGFLSTLLNEGVTVFSILKSEFFHGKSIEMINRIFLRIEGSKKRIPS
jgi:hypothetical protein